MRSISGTLGSEDQVRFIPNETNSFDHYVVLIKRFATMLIRVTILPFDETRRR